MCEYCKYSSMNGDEIECLFNHRKPTYEEYKECENFALPEELEKEFQEFIKEGE